MSTIDDAYIPAAKFLQIPEIAPTGEEEIDEFRAAVRGELGPAIRLIARNKLEIVISRVAIEEKLEKLKEWRGEDRKLLEKLEEKLEELKEWRGEDRKLLEEIKNRLPLPTPTEGS